MRWLLLAAAIVLFVWMIQMWPGDFYFYGGV